jgi:hypothetical protein
MLGSHPLPVLLQQKPAKLRNLQRHLFEFSKMTTFEKGRNAGGGGLAGQEGSRNSRAAQKQLAMFEV